MLRSTVRRLYREAVKVPKADEMMAVLHGHQVDVASAWMKKGADCCWLGDFAVLLEAYKMLDEQVEKEWVVGNGGKGAKTWSDFAKYCKQKQIFYKMWVPNPITVLSNAVNDEALSTWVTTMYPPANFNYLPLPVLMSLIRSFKTFSQGKAYTYIGRNNSMKPSHTLSSHPDDHPAGRLVRNWVLSALREKLFDGAQRVLIPNAGSLGGSLPLIFTTMKYFNGHVHALDPDSEVVKSLQYNHNLLKVRGAPRWKNLKAEVSANLTPRDRFRRFNLTVFAPPWVTDTDQEICSSFDRYYDLSGQDDRRDWLPSRDLFGNVTVLTDFFEEIQYAMDAGGHVVVVWSNFGNIVDGSGEHPIIKELEGNTRYSLHHFEDVPFKPFSKKFLEAQPHPFLFELNRRLRVELWVLKVNRMLLPMPPLVHVESQDSSLVPSTPEQLVSKKREEDVELTEYFHPPLPFLGNYMKRPGKTLIKEGGRPDPDTVLETQEQQAKDLLRQQNKQRRDRVKTALQQLGIEPKRPGKRK
eukprot:TRINITY_DN19218_c0_g1_i1.p1 TRINITY_DN19218_c0_g1~~TRINITY_DN19218_c0_g1_i1.p1  ORF type:complete len:524 (+),score=65.50 TRINITY_DN19218_c0_g1_i1:64-1635(+)